jgi:acetoacetyl-CoA synthetase
MARFQKEMGATHKLQFDDYASLHRWSIDDIPVFWSGVWDFCGVVSNARGDRVVIDADKMPGARWFPDARLNFAENLLADRGNSEALIFRSEDTATRHMSRDQLRTQVAAVARALREWGVVAGDRVVGFVPNMPEAIVAMLAATSIGAVWSSCSPDFGVQGVVDRFGQIEPRVVFTANGYRYNGKFHDSIGRVEEFLKTLPTVEHCVVINFDDPASDTDVPLPKATGYATILQEHAGAELQFAQLPFDHPLYIMYSSGTTGVPKCIVHSAGGALLQHLKEQQLHCDVKPGDRLFYFTTCGWMMWNWLVSGLASGATLVLYDGSPFYPNANVLFDYAEQQKIDIFGTSAKYIDAIAKEGIEPKSTHDLGSVRTILSTGSPLVPESFDYIYRSVKQDVCLSSVSGGTDLLACFAGGSPTLPVYRGELQCLILGMATDVFDDDGHAVRDEKGELVCTRAFPSMPIGFWNDDDGQKYHEAYFDRFDNIWCHGDFVELNQRGGMLIYGRSDAVLNPGGVRIGTAEIYRQVEQLDEVLESMVIGQQWQQDTRVVLFVRLRDSVQLDDALIAKIQQHIRKNTTPRHVPARVVRVEDIPRTKSGKIVELAVRNIVHGEPVKNREALANPEALAHFANRVELQS